jgi:hypothetical protein
MLFPTTSWAMHKGIAYDGWLQETTISSMAHIVRQPEFVRIKKWMLDRRRLLAAPLACHMARMRKCAALSSPRGPAISMPK